MKALPILLVAISAATCDLNGFHPIPRAPEVDRQGTGYSTTVHHHPDSSAQSSVAVTFGDASPEEARVTTVFNKDFYIPPKTAAAYQKPLYYQRAAPSDSQLFNVGYSVSFADAKKQLKKSAFRPQQEGEIITGTQKEAVQRPKAWRQLGPGVEILRSDEVPVKNQPISPQQVFRQSQKFDHANALGRSVGFDYTNAVEGGTPIYKKYVNPHQSLEKKAEEYFNRRQVPRVIQLQTAASNAVQFREQPQQQQQQQHVEITRSALVNSGDVQSNQLGIYDHQNPPLQKVPLDTRLLRNPVLLTPDSSYRPDPAAIPIHFDTRSIQAALQNDNQPQPTYPYQELQQQPQQQHHQLQQQQQQVLLQRQPWAYVEKRGSFKREAAPRQPRYAARPHPRLPLYQRVVYGRHS